MPIDMAPPSSNIQGYQIAPPESVDPLKTLAQMGELRQQGLKAQTAQMELQQQQLALQDQQGLRAAMAQWDGKNIDDLFDLGRQQNVSPTTLINLKNQAIEQKQKLATLTDTDLKNKLAQNTAFQSMLSPILKQTDPAKQATMWNQSVADAVGQGLLTDPQGNPLTVPQALAQHPYPGADGVQGAIAGLNHEKFALDEQREARAKASKVTSDIAEENQQIEKPAKIAKSNQEQAVALAPQLEAALKTGGMDAVNTLLDATPRAVANYFAAATKPGEFTAAALTPEQTMQDVRAKATEAETHRHNLSDESTARLNASIAAGRLAQEKLINGMKYGPDTAEYWAQQLVENPDSVKELPPEMRTNVGRLFSAKTGLPLPTPASAAAQTQETAARNALDGATFIQQALKNPEIRANLGPILGRLQNVEQTVGTAANLSPQAEQLAQELRTRMRYFVFQEGKAVLGGRLPEKLMGALEASSPNVKMDPDMLQGALNGATGNAQTVIDNVDRQRFGGKMRTPAQRQGAPARTHQANDTRVMGGVTYKRDAQGKWNAQ